MTMLIRSTPFRTSPEGEINSVPNVDLAAEPRTLVRPAGCCLFKSRCGSVKRKISEGVFTPNE